MYKNTIKVKEVFVFLFQCNKKKIKLLKHTSTLILCVRLIARNYLISSIRRRGAKLYVQIIACICLHQVLHSHKHTNTNTHSHGFTFSHSFQSALKKMKSKQGSLLKIVTTIAVFSQISLCNFLLFQLFSPLFISFCAIFRYFHLQKRKTIK